jgi:hypothetical protein
MYLIVIAWLYVVLMMSVAEATNATGTVLGAIVTFVMYGLGPAALVAYLMGTPARNRKIKLARQLEQEQAQHAPEKTVVTQTRTDWQKTASNPPDTGSHAAGGEQPVSAADSSVAPVRKEP